MANDHFKPVTRAGYKPIRYFNDVLLRGKVVS